jgi:hypothetical protein
LYNTVGNRKWSIFFKGFKEAQGLLWNLRLELSPIAEGADKDNSQSLEEVGMDLLLFRILALPSLLLFKKPFSRRTGDKQT